jgi:hypothetical protein
MNLQTLRETTNYSAFRAIGSSFGIVFIAAGILTTVASIGLIKSLGWSTAPAIISGIIIIAAGMVARELTHLVADIADIMLHGVHQQKAASRAAVHAPIVAPSSVAVLPNSEADFDQFVDNTIDSAHDARGPQDMLASAREMLNAGQKDGCKALLRELIRQHPQAPEADRARKALRGQG